MILDFILPRETKNLIKINKLAKQFIKHQNKDQLIWLKKEFRNLRPKTKEHKSKIDFYLIIIGACLKSQHLYSGKQRQNS